LGLVLLVLPLGACPADLEGDDPGECSDGADNDRDLLFDCDDPDCVASPACDGVVDDDDSSNVDDDDVSDDDDGVDDDDDDSSIGPDDIVVAEHVVMPGDDPCYAGFVAAEDMSSLEIDFDCEPTYGVFEEGQVVVGVDDEGGYLVWVDSVEQSGNTWIAETRPAGLLDLFEQATWDVLLDDWTDDERYTWTINETVSAGVVSAQFNGSLTVNPTVKFTGAIESYIPPKLKTFDAIIGGNANGSVSATFTVGGSTTYSNEIPLASWSKSKTFFIGYVPVNVGLALNTKIRYSVTATASAEATVGYQVTGMFEIGGQYRQSTGWTAVNNSNFTSSAIGPTATAVAGQIEAKVGLHVSAVLTLYSVEGPYIYFEPYVMGCLYLDASVPQIVWKYQYGIDLGAGINLTILGVEFADEELNFPGFPMSLGGDSGTIP